MPLKEGVINLDATVNPSRTIPGDNTTHRRYINVQHYATWYVPVSEQKTLTMKRNFTKASKGKTLYAQHVQSSMDDIVVHYHVRNWY